MEGNHSGHATNKVNEDMDCDDNDISGDCCVNEDEEEENDVTVNVRKKAPTYGEIYSLNRSTVEAVMKHKDWELLCGMLVAVKEFAQGNSEIADTDTSMERLKDLFSNFCGSFSARRKNSDLFASSQEGS